MKVDKKVKNQIMLNYIKAYMANDICPKKGELHVSENSAFKKYFLSGLRHEYSLSGLRHEKNPIEKLSEEFNNQVAVNGDYSNIKLPNMKINLIENKIKIINN
jgi:hypothetical protein